MQALFEGDRYQLLGSERDGVVLALDRTIQRQIELHLGPNDAGRRNAFLREARVLAQLDHPAIPKVHDSGLREGRPYYTLDELEGTALDGETRGDAGLHARLRTFLALCAGVAHAHERGLVHGHLRPEGMLLGRFGQVWITGWAHAVALEHAAPPARGAAAAPAPPAEQSARAPEVGRGRPPDERVDVWGLGGALHWLLFQRRYRGKSPPSGQGVPPDLRAVCKKALAEIPTQRYGSVAELQEDVRRYLDGRRVEAAQEGPLQTLRRLARRHPLQAGLGFVAALVIGALGAVALVSLEAKRRDAAEQIAKTTEASRQQRQLLERAKESAQEAESERERAAGERRQAELAAGAGELRLEHQVGFLSALTLRDPEEVEAAFARHQNALEGLVKRDDQVGSTAAELLRELHRTRGTWRTEQPQRATEALKDLAALGDDPSAQLVRYLVARRLPGEDQRRAEAEARDAASRSTPELGELIRFEVQLAEAEQLGREERDGEARTIADRVYGALTEQKAVEGPLPGEEVLVHLAKEGHLAQGRLRRAWVQELIGRALLILPGLYRRLDNNKELKSKYWWNRKYGNGLKPIANAVHADPWAPGPRLRQLRQSNIKYGQHAFWRHGTSVTWAMTFGVLRTTGRAWPFVEAARELQVANCERSSRPLIDEAFRRAEGDRLSPNQLALARIVRARAKLANGESLDAADLDRSGLTPDLLAEHKRISAWSRLAAGEVDAGLELLTSSFEHPEQSYYRYRRRERDVQLALLSPRARTQRQRLAQRLARHPMTQGKHGPRVQRAATHALAVISGQLRGVQLMPSRPEGADLLLLVCRDTLRSRPSDLETYQRLLLILGSLNNAITSTAPQARQAWILLRQRAERLRQKAAATALGDLTDPIWELAPPKAWLPRELHAAWLQGD